MYFMIYQVYVGNEDVNLTCFCLLISREGKEINGKCNVFRAKDESIA